MGWGGNDSENSEHKEQRNQRNKNRKEHGGTKKWDDETGCRNEAKKYSPCACFDYEEEMRSRVRSGKKYPHTR